MAAWGLRLSFPWGQGGEGAEQQRWKGDAHVESRCKSPRWTVHTGEGEGTAAGLWAQNHPGSPRLPGAGPDLPGRPGEAGGPRPWPS